LGGAELGFTSVTSSTSATCCPGTGWALIGTGSMPVIFTATMCRSRRTELS
jgi:hypothetical protein